MTTPVAPHPGDTLLDLAGGATDAASSVDLNRASAVERTTSLHSRRRYRIYCTCAASVTWNFNVGAVTGRRATKATATGTSAVFVGDDGPFDFAEIAWSGNSTNAAIYVDVHVETF